MNVNGSCFCLLGEHEQYVVDLPQALREPAPLFKKLDESVIEEEYARLEG